MNMFKKLALTALLVPSSMVVGCQAPIEVPATETIMGNFYASKDGFAEGIRKTALGYSRLTLNLSKVADATGNYFAENYWQLGGVTLAGAAALSGLIYWYVKRPSFSGLVSLQPVYRMWENGRARWVRPAAQPQQPQQEQIFQVQPID